MIVRQLLLLAAVAATAAAQGPAAGTVRGQVAGADDGRPVEGAQVFLGDQSIGAVTDAQGRYVLRSVPAGAVTVRTRMVGYGPATRPATVAPNADVVVDFRLDRSALALDQMVVTGTPGATERRAVGNAIATVNLADVAQTSPATSISGLLKGRAAGVTALPQSGTVGAGSAIRIRGAGSISLTNNPLIYVDGVRMDNSTGSILTAGTTGSSSRLDDINPDDIASVEIIKGPAAATLYGTEASNGVIQIITKKGAAGTSSVTAQLRGGANTLPDAAGTFPLNWYTTAAGQKISENLVEKEDAAGRPLFRTGKLTEGVLQAQGGNQTARYFLSGGYLANEGIYANNYLHRFSSRANVDAQLAKTLTVQGNVAYLQSTNPQMPEAATASYGLVPMLVFGSPASDTTRLRGFLRATPEATETIRQVEDINHTTLGLSSTFTPTTWLTSRLNTGLDWINQNDNTLYPFDPNGFFGALSAGNKTINQFQRRNITLDWATTGKWLPNADLQLATSVGLQFYDRATTLISGTSQNFPAPGLETLSAGAITTSGESYVQNKTLGGYVQEELSSKNRRFLTLAVRGDANSAFGDKYAPAYYPKVSAAWVVSDEGIPMPGFVSQLRLRGAFGFAGLQPDALAAVRTYAPVAGTGGQAAILPQSPGNRTIRPERARELELGFDADLFSGRGSLVMTYFHKRTTDALVAVPSAPSTGFPGTEFRNLGVVTNSGFEAEANATPVSTRRVQWSLGGTVTRVTNLVNSLGGSPPINTGQGFNTIQIHEGYPIGSFFAKKVVSADRGPNNTAVNVLCDGGPAANHAAVACATAPVVFLADPGPGWEVGAHSSLRLGQSLTLAASVDGQLDTHLFSSMLFARDAAFRNSFLANHLDEMPVTEIASIAIGSNAPFIANNSFVRFRELSANYDVPASLTRHTIGGRAARLGLAVRNLGFLYRNKESEFIDPETALTQISWVHFEQAQTPQLRSVVLSLQVTY
jgi:TonB-linked SusC/RagA family outer membrane protein